MFPKLTFKKYITLKIISKLYKTSKIVMLLSLIRKYEVMDSSLNSVLESDFNKNNNIENNIEFNTHFKEIVFNDVIVSNVKRNIDLQLNDNNLKDIEFNINDMNNSFANDMSDEKNETQEVETNSRDERRNFTINFKLNAINYYKSEKINCNKSNAEKFSQNYLGRHVSRQLFQKWLKQESELRQLKEDISLSDLRKRRVCKSKNRPNFPEIESKTMEKVRQLTELGLQVTDSDIKKFSTQALDELRAECPFSEELSFKASNGWRHGFKQRNGLLLRPTVEQQIADNEEESGLEDCDINSLKEMIRNLENINKYLVISNDLLRKINKMRENLLIKCDMNRDCDEIKLINGLISKEKTVFNDYNNCLIKYNFSQTKNSDKNIDGFDDNYNQIDKTDHFVNEDKSQRRVHSINKIIDTKRQSNNNNNKLIKRKRVKRLSHKCEYEDCGKLFYDKRQLERHYDTIHRKKQFYCYRDGCNVEFALKSSFQLHNRRYHTKDRPFKCNFTNCGKTFSLLRDLKSHRELHNSKQFKCQSIGCNRVYARNLDLMNHMKVKHSDVKHMCLWPGCEQEFNTKCDLKVHTCKHTNDGKWKCPFKGCDKAFALKRHLQRHRAIHGDEGKPFVCEWPACDSRFVTTFELLSHRSIHTGFKKYKCEFPGCDFETNRDMSTHRRTHTGEKPYKCEICGKQIRDSSNFIKHKKKHLK